MSFVLLIFLLINAVLNITVSTKPSCDPRSTLSDSGSCTSLAGYVLESMTIPFEKPSTIKPTAPDRINVINLSISFSADASI